jgi:hypothetical protein
VEKPQHFLQAKIGETSDLALRARQVLSASLLLIVVMVILYPTTATGTVMLTANYVQAPIQTEIPGEGPKLVVVKGVTHLFVSFSEIRIHVASEGNGTGWLPLTFQTNSIDLIDLENKSEVIMSSPTVPAGEYDNLMLSFANATAVVNGSTVRVESIPRSVVRESPFTVIAGSETNLRLRFTADYRALNASKQVFFDVNPTVE